MAIKILGIDIETAPNKVYTWELWGRNLSIPTGHVIDSRYILCVSAKWFGEDDIIFTSIHGDGTKRMLAKVRKLLDEADAVVHYNGKKFDIPALNKEFITHGLPPPSFFHQIDLLSTMRSRFKFTSNKLDYVCRELGLGNKVQHKGMELWTGCMEGDEESWKIMEEYNKHDVVLLEKLYEKVLPWIKNHPNRGLYEKDAALVCTHCGSNHYQRRGYYRSKTHTYARYQCQSCGAWFRSNVAEDKRGEAKFVGAA